MEDDKIIMELDDGSEQEFTILEETKVGGVSYILVSDTVDEDEEDGTCYVFKDVTPEDSEEAVYESIEDEKELDAVLKVFEKLLEDEIDIER